MLTNGLVWLAPCFMRLSIFLYLCKFLVACYLCLIWGSRHVSSPETRRSGLVFYRIALASSPNTVFLRLIQSFKNCWHTIDLLPFNLESMSIEQVAVMPCGNLFVSKTRSFHLGLSSDNLSARIGSIDQKKKCSSKQVY